MNIGCCIIRFLMPVLLVLAMAFSCDLISPETDPVPGDETETPSTPEPDEVFYVMVSEYLSDWSGDYLLAYSSSGAISVFNSWSGEDKGTTTVDLQFLHLSML